jgi:hypothetical protein
VSKSSFGVITGVTAKAAASPVCLGFGMVNAPCGQFLTILGRVKHNAEGR